MKKELMKAQTEYAVLRCAFILLIALMAAAVTVYAKEEIPLPVVFLALFACGVILNSCWRAGTNAKEKGRSIKHIMARRKVTYMRQKQWQDWFMEQQQGKEANGKNGF